MEREEHRHAARGGAAHRLEAVDAALEELERVQRLLLEEVDARNRVAPPSRVLVVRKQLRGELGGEAYLLPAVGVVHRLGGAAAQVDGTAQRAQVGGIAPRRLVRRISGMVQRGRTDDASTQE